MKGRKEKEKELSEGKGGLAKIEERRKFAVNLNDTNSGEERPAFRGKKMSRKKRHKEEATTLYESPSEDERKRPTETGISEVRCRSVRTSGDGKEKTSRKEV